MGMRNHCQIPKNPANPPARWVLSVVMEKILLIDDEADVQYSFRRIFGSAEMELTTAGSGEEGLQLIPRV